MKVNDGRLVRLVQYPTRLGISCPIDGVGGWHVGGRRGDPSLYVWSRKTRGHRLSVWYRRERSWGFSVDGCSSRPAYSSWEEAHEKAIDELNRILEEGLE